MCCFFFNDTATTEIYTLSLHDALPIWSEARPPSSARRAAASASRRCRRPSTTTCGSRCRSPRSATRRSEEHTSELQSRQYLVCRLLLEKKNSYRPARAHVFTAVTPESP